MECRTLKVDNNEIINILDYILAQTGENECPNKKISVFNTDILGLLDSDANGIFASIKPFTIFLSLGFELTQFKITNCKSAKNNQLECVGQVTVPFTSKN